MTTVEAFPGLFKAGALVEDKGGHAKAHQVYVCSYAIDYWPADSRLSLQGACLGGPRSLPLLTKYRGRRATLAKTSLSPKLGVLTNNLQVSWLFEVETSKTVTTTVKSQLIKSEPIAVRSNQLILLISRLSPPN